MKWGKPIVAVLVCILLALLLTMPREKETRNYGLSETAHAQLVLGLAGDQGKK